MCVCIYTHTYASNYVVQLKYFTILRYLNKTEERKEEEYVK